MSVPPDTEVLVIRHEVHRTRLKCPCLPPWPTAQSPEPVADRPECGLSPLPIGPSPEDDQGWPIGWEEVPRPCPWRPGSTSRHRRRCPWNALGGCRSIPAAPITGLAIQRSAGSRLKAPVRRGEWPVTQLAAQALRQQAVPPRHADRRIARGRRCARASPPARAATLDAPGRNRHSR